jgi:hypothetical protein
MCKNTEPDRHLESCPGPRCQLVSRNILPIFPFKEKSFGFTPHLPTKASRAALLFLSLLCASPLPPTSPARLSDSSAFPFSNRHFLVRVSTPSCSAAGVWEDAAPDEAALTGAGPFAHPWRGRRSECTRPGKGTM